MAFDWTQDDDAQPTLSDGFHLVKITKVKTLTKEGEEIRSKKKNERMIFVDVEDVQDGQSQGVPLMLEGAGVFNIRRLMHRVNADVARMKAEGIEPIRFANQGFAEKQLVGRKVWVSATRNGDQTNINFIKEEEVPPLTVKAYQSGSSNTQSAPPVDDENIPF